MSTRQANFYKKGQKVTLILIEGNPDMDDSQIKLSIQKQPEKFREDCLNQQQELDKNNIFPKKTKFYLSLKIESADNQSDKQYSPTSKLKHFEDYGPITKYDLQEKHQKILIFFLNKRKILTIIKKCKKQNKIIQQIYYSDNSKKHFTQWLQMYNKISDQSAYGQRIKDGQMVQFIKDDGKCYINGKLIHSDGHAYEREWLDEELNFYSQKERE
ncbi:unnamed protein product [Paramecium pentaurelia]|uniref:Uncharacterized protein n=1 Tax=Paramecium pentaurelia TaxID=43138 RepID=A0A8S1XXQ8_9CILI|nr:unnamed protein product [Paramecium pentaurelia]